jgi:dynamin 1-like protein
MEGKNKKKFTNFSEVRKTIDAVTDHVCGSKKCIVDKPIILNIFSATCPNLTIVDLPGITSIPVGEQPKNIYEITRDMALNYIK